MTLVGRSMLSIIIIFSSLLFAHFVKFVGVVGNISMPASIGFLSIYSGLFVVFILYSYKLRFKLDYSFIANMVPCLVFACVPGVVGFFSGYDTTYLMISIFNMSLVWMLVLLGTNITIASFKNEVGISFLVDMKGYFVFVLFLMALVGGGEILFFLVNEQAYRAFTTQLVDKNFLSIAPFWTVLDHSYPRIFGYFQNPLTYGFLSLFLALYFWAIKKWLVVILCGIGILLSLTKTLFFITCAAIIMVFLTKTARLRSIVAAQFFFGIVFASAILGSYFVADATGLNREAYQSIITRVMTWRSMIDLITSDIHLLPFGHAITQVAYNNPVGINDVNYAIDNMFLLLILYSGIFGLLLFLFMYYFNLADLVKKTSHLRGTPWRIGRALIALWSLMPVWGIGNALIGNFSVFYFTYAVVLVFLWSSDNKPASLLYAQGCHGN